MSVGTNLTYASQIKNNGRFDATTVTLIDVLRAGVTFISAAASQGACSDQSVIRTVRCDLGAIANHGSASATVVVRPLQRTTVSNQVVVGANQGDPNVTNNTAMVKTVVR